MSSTREYNAKLVEIACANANAAFDYASELNGVRSPAQFIQLTTEHARKRFYIASAELDDVSSVDDDVAWKSIRLRHLPR